MACPIHLIRYEHRHGPAPDLRGRHTCTARGDARQFGQASFYDLIRFDAASGELRYLATVVRTATSHPVFDSHAWYSACMHAWYSVQLSLDAHTYRALMHPAAVPCLVLPMHAWYSPDAVPASPLQANVAGMLIGEKNEVLAAQQHYFSARIDGENGNATMVAAGLGGGYQTQFRYIWGYLARAMVTLATQGIGYGPHIHTQQHPYHHCSLTHCCRLSTKRHAHVLPPWSTRPPATRHPPSHGPP